MVSKIFSPPPHSHDALKSNLFCGVHLMFARFVISQMQPGDVHLSLTTLCASQLCDHTQTSSGAEFDAGSVWALAF